MAVQDFEMRLEDCLAVNDNRNADNENDSDTSRRTNVPIVKRQPQNRGGKTKSKQLVQKGRQLRGGRRNMPSSDDSSDSEIEKENPRREKAKQRVIESDSDDDEPMPRKISQTRKPPVRASRASNRTKVIEELSTSGENILRENNSFEA